MDSTIDPEPASSADTSEIAVQLDTLTLDGVRPKVGDNVDFKVSGPILKIVNDMAVVRPEMANEQPIPQQPATDEMDQLAKASEGVMLGSEY